MTLSLLKIKLKIMCRDKVQKITEALYRVTEFFPDEEPLKWRLRNASLEIFDFSASWENKNKDEIFGVENILNLIQRIDSALQLASSFGGYIPSINFEILRREYLSLAESLQSQFQDKSQELRVLESVKSLLPVSLPAKDFDSNGQSNGQSENSNGHLPTGEFIDNGHNGQNRQTNENNITSTSVVDVEKNPIGDRISKKERKRKILGLISAKGGSAPGGKENEWISVHEISSSLPEFGEKSIQRDILEMVEAGILKKTGDKRWRKYSLVG